LFGQAQCEINVVWGETDALVWSGTVQREINVVWGETEALVYVALL